MVCRRRSHALNAWREGLALIVALAATGLLAAPALSASWPTGGSLTANTSFVTITGATTAAVTGTVDPAGRSTSYKAVYDLASSTWCTSNATSGEPASFTTATTLPYTDFHFHAVVVSLTGLTAGTKYCVAISATSSSGTATGSPVQFT